MLLAALALAYGGCFALLVRSLCARPHKRNYTRCKTLVSAGFIGTALACAAARGTWAACLALLPAMGLYLAGDVLLGLNNRLHTPQLLAAGAAAFFAGHICLLGVLVRRQGFAAADFIFPAATAAAAACLLWHKKPEMPSCFGPGILLYTFAVALAAAKCVHLFAVCRSTETALLAGGAVLFAVSDCVIPLVHFTPRRSLAAHLVNLSTYYGGMFLLAASVYFAAP